MSESIERTQSAKEKLHNLEAENKYVFHGSENSDIKSFEPRQAYNYRNDVQETDGDPAVFASSKADYAIMMALINKANCPNGYKSAASSRSTPEGDLSLELSTSKNGIDQLNEETLGYVYVFNKSDFEKRGGGVEYISKTAVNPIDRVVVEKSDLPESLVVL